MGTSLRKVPLTADALRDAANKLKKQIAAMPHVQVGTTTLVGGTVTVSSVSLNANSQIFCTRRTSGGAAGHLAAPSANRTAGVGSGSFVISSSSGTDTSTVDWMIVTPGGVHAHLDAAETARTITSANASDLATSLTLLNELCAKYALHLASSEVGDGLAHLVADATNTVATSEVTALAAAQTRANALKTAYNAHRSQSGVHSNDDPGNQVTSSDASDQSSLNTLLNEIKTDFNNHLASAPTSAAPSIRLLDA